MKNLSATKHTSPQFSHQRLFFLFSLSAFLSQLFLNAQAYTEIQPPVVATLKPGQKPEPMFTFTGSTTLHSDLRWRGVSITDQRPGFSSNVVLGFNRGRFSNFAIINGYSFNVTSPQLATDNAGSAGFTEISSIMTESKVGARIRLGSSPKSTMALSVAHGIYMWPGASVWQYQAQTCTSGGTSSVYLVKNTYPSSVKSVHATEIAFTWGEVVISYSGGDTSDTTDNLNTLGGTPMSKEYLHVQTARHYINAKYSVSGEYGYWKNIGRHFGGHLNYDFSDRMMGTLKSYNFETLTNSISSNSGLALTLQFRFQPDHTHEHKKR